MRAYLHCCAQPAGHPCRLCRPAPGMSAPTKQDMSLFYYTLLYTPKNTSFDFEAAAWYRDFADVLCRIDVVSCGVNSDFCWFLGVSCWDLWCCCEWSEQICSLTTYIPLLRTFPNTMFKPKDFEIEVECPLDIGFFLCKQNLVWSSGPIRWGACDTLPGYRVLLQAAGHRGTR